MLNDLIYYQQINKNIAAIINGHDTSLYHEQERENIFELSIPIIQKKLKKMNEQLIFYHAENRLLYNYLIWYEKKILQQQKNSINISLIKTSYNLIENKQPLSIDKKREIAEIIFKILLGYSQKYENNTSQYVDECINTIETNDEIINYLENEIIILKKSFQHIQKKFTIEELLEFFHDRIRYQESLNERKRQKTVRLRFNLDNIEKSIRKVHQIVDTITEIDFEQLKIDIEKQLKELNIKNKMLIFYKQQQSEANMKFNSKKPELFNEIRTFTFIRNETNNRIQQLNHYDQIKQKLQDEINQYEKLNEPLREMNISYRVPSINNYVDLKSKQIYLHRQNYAWERKVQIAERELHLRQIEIIHKPEKIIHPWKYLQNPSSILFYQYYKTNEMK